MFEKSFLFDICDWYQEQDAEILAYSPYITNSKVDPCLYIYKHEEVTALLSVHTDDHLCVSNDPTWMENFHKSYTHLIGSLYRAMTILLVGLYCGSLKRRPFKQMRFESE